MTYSHVVWILFHSKTGETEPCCYPIDPSVGPYFLLHKTSNSNKYLDVGRKGYETVDGRNPAPPGMYKMG